MGNIPFRERLKQGVILADGAMGTTLHASGVDLSTCFDHLNLTHPAVVFDIHRDYLDAGAEIIETNTFGANRFKLAEHGLEDSVVEINRTGVSLARQAVSTSFKPDIYVAASVGPLGVWLAPFGRVTSQQAYEAFHEQISALCDAGADVLILETFSDLHELREAVRAAHSVCSLPIIAQVTFTRDDRTMLGDTPAQAARALAEMDVDVIGVNCSNGPAQIMRIVRAMQAALPLDLGMLFSAVPNAGWPENVGGRVMYASGPDYFADYAVALRDRGVSIVGGCCGTTPQHIAAMREALDNPAFVTPIVITEGVVDEEIPVASTPAPSQLAQKLRRGDFVVAVEMTPPRGIVPDKLLQAAQMLLSAGADVVDVTDSPMARMRMSPWAVCYLLQSRVGIETVLHFPTRGRNLLRVQGDLLAAHALGIRNLFVVMGDPTQIGDYPDAADNYDIVPSGLIRLIKQSLNLGKDWAGNNIGEPTSFLVSAALNLNPPDIDREMKTLEKKLASGADYLLTQPVYDVAAYRDFIKEYRQRFGEMETPVLVGLLPLYSVRHASFLHNEVPGITIPNHVMQRIADSGEDAPREGVRIAQELAGELAQLGAGIYIMPQFKRYDLSAEIIEYVRTQTG
nr:bifunctional homocysteine S-methyltransferase/methylenetetrahydrofolate reductase [Anaerolineae bacterium]